MKSNIMGAIENTVPISLFNKGLAGKIFTAVKQSGAKVVMKNNVAECVLLSPEEYTSLIEEVNNARLIAVAAERMKNFDEKETLSQEEVYKALGITSEELEDVEVEIE